MNKVPFIPPKLPPEIDVSELIGLLADTRDAVARFDEAVKRLPNPALIRRAFETQEAVLSSRIEGTQATLEEVLEFDAEEDLGEDTDKAQDYREIRNYRLAIDSGKELLKDQPLSENMMKRFHEILMNSVRGRHKRPGEFRDYQVHIGPPGATIEEARYIPPAHTKITELMNDLVEYLHSDEAPDRLIQVAIAHYQFEAIHPFADGNGRVGRLIIPLYLYEQGIISYPNLYISEFLETHRRDYYDTLNAVSEKDEWIPWIQFFLRAVREQATLSRKRVEKVEQLYKDLQARLPEFNSIYAPAFLEALFVKPVFNIGLIGREANIVTKKSLYGLVDKFEEAGLIVDASPGRSRNKLYVFEPLIDIIES